MSIDRAFYTLMSVSLYIRFSRPDFARKSMPALWAWK